MERRNTNEICLEDVDGNESDSPAMVHVDMAGSGYASFNPTGHIQEREDEDSPADGAPVIFR